LAKKIYYSLLQFSSDFAFHLEKNQKVSGVGFSSVVNQNKKRKLPKDRELNFAHLIEVV